MNPAAQGQYEPNMMGYFAFMLIMMFIFYFFVLRPQQNKEKERQTMIKGLKKGDKIITNGGIFGHVWDVKDDLVVVKINQDVKIEVSKDAVHLVDKKQS